MGVGRGSCWNEGERLEEELCNLFPFSTNVILHKKRGLVEA